NASSKTVVWSSSNTSVATVANGKVTAVSAGIAEISALTMDGEYKAVCVVTVTNGEITVKNSAGVPGKTARVNIDITENPGIAVVGLEICYDRDVLTLESFENGVIFDDGDADGNPENYPFVYNAYCADSNKTDNGKLLTLIFSVKDDAPFGNYDVTVSSVEAIDINERDVYLECINGIVRIMDCPGDVTGDGELNRKDLLRLAKFFAGWDVTLG
ncbi:MAG: Ig-like domain-containing protein, partial [Clostridia bacterium]|nr:Ig-like domain-containing protein [Clostridia bacterium]